MAPVHASEQPGTGEGQQLYERRCGVCHGNDVRKLARRDLLLSGNRITTRQRELELREFLGQHGRPTSSEADQIYQLLWRVLVDGDAGGATPR